MPSFKQKSVIRSYKLRLQEKLKTVTVETNNSISFLNNCLLEFKNRVQHILEIKDEKCLSLYRKLSSDLENYSEKLFILQASLGEISEEDTDSSENEESESGQPTDRSNSAISESRPLTDQYTSVPDLSSHVQGVLDENVKSKLGNSDEGASCAAGNEKSELANSCDIVFYPKKDKPELDSDCEEAFCPEKDVILKVDSYCESAFNPENDVKSSYYEGASDIEDNKAKLENYHEGGGSVTEDDFCSLHGDSVSQNIASDNVLLNSQRDRYEESNDKYETNRSFSQSSYYRSLSSNISEPLLLSPKKAESTQSSKTNLANENENSLESESPCIIHPSDVKVSSKISATLVHVVDPGDFWIQIENSCISDIKFSKVEYCHLSCLTSIREGYYCLAPFKSTPFFYRALSLSNAKSGKDKVKVQFIDHGSTQEIHLWDLRSLPSSAYDIPAQAIHCFLDGVAPIDDTWSIECIEKFKDFRDFDSIEVIIKSKESLYAVQLIANSSEDFIEDLSVDVALYLCLEGLAISENESISRSMDLKAVYESKPATSINSLEVLDMTAISSDSGVSVTSAYKSNKNSASTKQINKIENTFRQGYDKISAIPVGNSCIDFVGKKFGFINESQAQDLILCESSDILDLQNSSEIAKFANNSSKSICHMCKRDNFCLHLKVPPPHLVFVEKDMMIVMLSHIVTPHEFYVNLAMENIVNLDELREQMTTTYDSQGKDLPPVRLEDLYENMFCAGYYDVDGYWYRVKITGINKNNKEGLVTVQYIDYGNKATIQCSNLQPLMPQFSQHPTFAIKCSLAGIIPAEDNPVPVRGAFPSIWDEYAVSAFKKITSCDRCLTAQICTKLCTENNDILPVLLWDTEESIDQLINLALADIGVAKCDEKLLPLMPFKNEIHNPSGDISSPSKAVEADIMNAWDPMAEEYNDIENSYGVNDEDIQIITSGYQAKDEEYTCKYFSLRGYCPRGANCPYEHLPLLESGVTRDQEEVYCLDSVPIIPDTTVNTIVSVSTIINPNHFYIILPYGSKTVNEINSLVNRGCSEDDILNSEAKVLFYAINKHYSTAPFQENTRVSLACGTIVAAKRSWDKKWHRGRVVDVSNITEPAKIFFVDSGDSEWVPRKFIRTILQQFLYTPFQAIQCSLKRIAPIGSKDQRWHSDAVNFFRKAVEGESLLAENIHRLGQVFHLTLRRTNKDNHRYIGQLLVSAGLAQLCSDVPSEKKESRYVPG